MRAVVFPGFGAAPEVRDDVDVPDPAEGEVRVRVRAASVNGFDLAVAAGMVQGMMEHRFPVVLGKDFAGVIDAVGPGVDGYAVGDRVFGVVTKPFVGDGSFGEFVTVPVAVGLAKLPEPVSFTDGAALGLAGTAALDCVDAAALRPGQSVLIAGATGGVGSYAVQFAAQAGATVIATAHTGEDKDLVTRLGLTLPTVSGVLADLDRAGFIDRQADPADRRRTLVQVLPVMRDEVEQWLDGAASPLARVLDKLEASERAAFLKAMDMLEAELSTTDPDP